MNFSNQSWRERGRACWPCVMCGLLPPAAYSAIAVAALVSPALLLLIVIFILVVFVLLRVYNRRSRAPAYATIVGHFGTAVITFVVKLWPVAGSDVKDAIQVSSGFGSEDEDGTTFDGILLMVWEAFSQEAWLLSITIFIGLQVAWQEIPNFYKEVALPGSSYRSKVFVNPHDEGLVRNFRAMLRGWM